MRKVSSFNLISLDGYYRGQNEDIGWHQHHVEEAKFSEENLKYGNVFFFYRKTYEAMASLKGIEKKELLSC